MSGCFTCNRGSSANFYDAAGRLVVDCAKHGRTPERRKCDDHRINPDVYVAAERHYQLRLRVVGDN